MSRQAGYEAGWLEAGRLEAGWPEAGRLEPWSYLKCQIIEANELLDQQEVAFSKHMHMAT